MSSCTLARMLGAACLTIALAGTTARAQEVQRYLGSPQTEELKDIDPVFTTAGLFDGYVACGYRDFQVTGGGLNRDFYVVRLRPDGTVIWSVRWGTGVREEATSVVQTADGGFAVVGEIDAQPLGLGILKLSAAGGVQWARQMVGGGFLERVATQTQRTPGATILAMNNTDVALVSYRRISTATFDQQGVFYRFDLAGATLAARVYIDTNQQITQMSLTDLREYNANGDIGIAGTLLSPFGAPINYDIDPLYLRVNGLGNPLGATIYPTFGLQGLRGAESGDGMEIFASPGGVPSMIISGFTDFSIPGPVTITGLHLLRINAANGAVQWMNRYANFYNGYAAVERDRRTGDVVVAGLLQNFSSLPLPAVAGLLKADALSGAFVWERGYFHPGTNSTAAAGLTQIPDASFGFALVGMGFSPSPYGSFDGFFVKTNNYGLTGCKELIHEPASPPINPDPRGATIASTFVDTNIWQASFATVSTADTFACLGTGCCNAADVTDVGGGGPCDGQLTVDDLILWVNEFSTGTGCPGLAPCNIADITGIGGPPAGPDGQLTVDDQIAFVNAFSDGCP